MEASPSVDIRHELIELILSKCPVKSVVRFKSVSKPWQSLTSCPRFQRVHHIQRSERPENQNKFLFYAESVDSHNHQLYLIGLGDGKYRREAWSGDLPTRMGGPLCSCDGLILLWKRGYREYVLWNPFIRKHIIIPHPKPKSESHIPWNSGHSHLYYYDSDYKIVYVYRDWYAVYSCNSGSWGETKDFPSDRIGWRKASFDGCIYDMQHGPHESNGEIMSDGIMMCFDVREGKLHEVPKPKGAECLDGIDLKAVSGRLCLYGFTKDGGGLHLWVMELERNNININNGCGSWRKLMSMEKQGVLSYIHHQTLPICLSNEDDVVLWSNGKHFIYNSRRKSLQEANFTWEISHCYCPYQENLYMP